MDSADSDYSEVQVPWGPEWQNESILNLVQAQHKAKFFAQMKKKRAAGTGDEKAFQHLLLSDARELKASGFEAWQRSIDKKKIIEPLAWIKDSPAYQDYDNGFR